MNLTNFQKWQSYTSDLPSPEKFITWSWLYLVSASLQRRIWCPPNHDKLYPNIYPILVGAPAIGKGGPIRRVSSILSQFKLDDFQRNGHIHVEGLSEDEKVIWTKIREDQLKKAQTEHGVVNGNVSVDKVPLLPSGGDAITYEALIQSLARAYRYVNFVHYDDKLQKNKMGIYGHCSMYFCLEELASLFKKKTENLLTFLIQAYDCSDEYRYTIKHGGEDRLSRICLNMFAGTVPEFMQSIFSDELVTSGFSSRVFFIYATKNRKTQFFRPELTDEQKIHRDEITEHIRKLTYIYGQVELEPETMPFLELWLRDVTEHPEKLGCNAERLRPFIGRINIHVMKVAMALHFGETTDKKVPHYRFLQAIELIVGEMKSMALALVVGDKNPLAKPSKKVVKFLLENGPQNFKTLLAEFWEEGLRKVELEEVLNFLAMTDQTTIEQVKDELTQQTQILYKVI